VKRTIAIDFDGVIHQYRYGWQSGKIYDPPVDGAFEAMSQLIRAGFDLVIHTTREDHVAIKLWLKQWVTQDYGEELSAVFQDIPITNKKPPAIAYIDDRGLRFTNWNDIRKYFM
jgi:hypothetical protein